MTLFLNSPELGIYNTAFFLLIRMVSNNLICLIFPSIIKLPLVMFIICAVKPRPSGRGYKAQSVKEGFVAVEYIV